MTDNKQLLRATYAYEDLGDVRTIYNLETDEVLFCARDVAKIFGYHLFLNTAFKTELSPIIHAFM